MSQVSHCLRMAAVIAGMSVLIGPVHADPNGTLPSPSGKAADQQACLLGTTFSIQDLSKWMGDLVSTYPDVSLSDIVLPGSHDAGIYRLGACTDYAESCNTQTQLKSISAQLEAGTRWFDLRPVYDSRRGGRGFFAGHYEEHVTLPLGIKLGTQGCLGGSLDEIHRDINTFLNAHTDEVVILFYSHFAMWGVTRVAPRELGIDLERAFISKVKEDFGSKLYTTSMQGYLGLSKTPIAEIRGKSGRVIATFDFGAAHNQILSDPEHGIFVKIPRVWGVPGLNRMPYEVGDEKYNRAACGVSDWSVIKAAQKKNEHLNDHLQDILWSDEINIVIYDAVNQVNNRQIINYNFP